MTDAELLAEAEFRLARVAALVREHPVDAVPVIGVAELAGVLAGSPWQVEVAGS